MKKETILYHSEIIQKMITYIENNKFNRINLCAEKLGEVALISPKHTSRIFKAGTGESLKHYILRVRLEAAKELRISGVSITDTSQMLEYENLPAFSAEYKKHFGYPPSKEGCASTNKYEPLKTSETMNLKEKIIKLNPTPVIFVQTIGSYKSNAPDKAWKTLWDFVEKKKLNVDKSDFFGIVHDDTEVTKETQCRYDACITLSKEVKTDGRVGSKIIDGGKYAVFTHKGSYKTLDDTYDLIFGPWLADNKEKLDDRPVLEKYLNDPDETKEEDLLTEIYVPLV